MHDSAIVTEIAGTLAALALCASLPIGRALHRLPEAPRAAFESFAGGAGIAYVTLDLLVELTYTGRGPVHAAFPVGPQAEHSLFAVVLAGLTLSFTLDALASRRSPRALYRVHVVWSTVYNGVVGGALVLEAEYGLWHLALYALAMLLHLSAREEHALSVWPDEGRATRVVMTVAPAVGAVLWAEVLPPPALYVALAFVAGTTLVLVFRLELPAPRGLRIVAFVAGVVVYAALVAMRWVA